MTATTAVKAPVRKLRLGVDLDNTSGDYTNALRQSIAKILDIPEDQIMDKFPIVRDYAMGNNGWHEMDTMEKFFALHSQAVADGMFTTLKAYEGVSDVLWRAHAKGHHIRIITARFLKPGDRYNVGQTTFQWLDDNNIPVDDIAFTDQKTDIDADVYIDDSPSNIFKLRAAGKTVIIFHQEYNKDIDGLRAHNWGEVEAILNTLESIPLPVATVSPTAETVEAVVETFTPKAETEPSIEKRNIGDGGNALQRLGNYVSRNVDRNERWVNPKRNSGWLARLGAYSERNIQR